ncbi:hypothetical protein CBR_g26164 [Chara braunii]|uniref:Integrase catalytic domain-containing protein n=1 Tax=Chara braunii TaxID=69332 RepID=A0A388L751_CHABU|nr:hypothetical protein CBR_g26164 [Chara braunii]|eukprot:GBG78127.1 hypothetical protein CBR_g26164 [Chara braunii]
MAATADANDQASPKRPVTPPVPVQQADEPLLAFLKRLQLYSETTAAELSKWEEEEAARQQEVQRQLAEAEAARQQAAAEAAAAERLQQQQAEASKNQLRYQATMELANEEATYPRILRQQHFRASEEQEEPTEEERNKVDTTVLMENLLYTCNWQQCELLAMRQTLSNRVQQRPAAVAKEWKMSNFKIEKFDDYHKIDPLQWWMAFNAEADMHHTPALRQLDALYLQLIGGAQAFMTHMAVTLECTIATLHTKIMWEEFEKKWKTRFMVNNDKRHALNKIFRMFQGQQPSREWLTEWERLVATPELNFPFDAIRAEFFARSCDALTAALGSEFQYETFDDMISKARELIQVNRRAASEARQQPSYVEKGKGQRMPQVAAVQQGPSMSWLQSEDHTVNFYRRTVHVRDRRSELVPCTVPLPHPSIGCHVVSAASIRQSIRQNDIEEMGICFLHALPPGDQPKTDTSDPRIIELLDSYEDVFQAPAGVVPDRPICHGITLEDGAVPPRGCIYRMSEEELQVLRAQLDDLLAKGWIRPSFSPYGAPVLSSSTTDARSFLGSASYYMRFVKGFQRTAAPLSRLQSPLVPFEFNDEARHAFHTLKTALLQAPVLSIYARTFPTKVTTDASGYGIGAVLEQHDGTDCHLVQYFSQKVPPINTLDNARKKELLAFVTVLKRWRHFLCQRFTWATDNNRLTYYKTQDMVSNTIGRWMYFIDQFNFTSKHISGSSNKAEDALSQRPDLCALVHSTFGLNEDLQQHFVNGYKSDPGFSTLYADLSSDHPPTSNYHIVDGYLLLHTRGKDLLCVFPKTASCALTSLANTMIRSWQDTLASHAHLHDSASNFTGRTSSATSTGLSIAMDLTGPFPRDRLGHDGILTVVDRLSKYARFLPCKYHATAPELARLLHTGWFCSHGVPEDIVNDHDTRFMSAFWTTLKVESSTSMKPSSAQHPQTDGQTERAHQTAQMMLRTLIRPDQKDWVDRLPDIEFAYNTSVHPAIDVTPFKLHHGGRKGHIFTDMLLPRAADIDAACSPASTLKYRELLAKARANMQKAQVRMQQQANRRCIPCPIRVGDLVWVTSEEFALEQHVSRKLLPKWFGPWKVTSAAGDDPAGPSFITEIPPHLTVHPIFHTSKLAVYTPASAADFPGRRSQDPPSMDGHQEVDRVIAHRKHDNKPMQYKVTFKQCDPDDTRWISQADLKATTPLIFAHYEKQQLAKEAVQPARPVRTSDRQLRPRG